MLLTVCCNFVTSSRWARTSRPLRGAIVAVVLLSSVNTALSMHDVVYFATTEENSLYTLSLGTRPQIFEPAIAGLIAFIVHGELATRASRIISSPWIAWTYLVALCSGSLVQLLMSIGLSYESWFFSQGVFTTSAPLDFSQFLEGWAWGAAAVDVIISITYIYLLRQKLKHGNEITQGVLVLIGRGIIESAAYTAVMAVATALVVQCLSQTNTATYRIGFAFWVPLSALYPLSLFSNFSIADRVTNRLSEFPATGLATASVHLRMHVTGDPGAPSIRPTLTQRNSSLLGVRVEIERDRYEEKDDDDGMSGLRRSSTQASRCDLGPRTSPV